MDSAMLLRNTLLLFACIYMTSSYLLKVKVVEETTTLRNDLIYNLNDMKSAKTQASNFSGPNDLRHLLGKCYLYSSDKYNYRVCPFDNITQHERLWHTSGYNGVIGVWKEWKILNNTFDSLMYYNGDDCGERLERSARMELVCGQDNKVSAITEPSRCHYEVSFTSNFACGDDYIYPNLDEEYRAKWDVIESNYFYEELTQLGYETALHQLFVEAGIVLNKFNSSERNHFYFENTDQCIQTLVSLKQENSNLLQRIYTLENALNNTRV